MPNRSWLVETCRAVLFGVVLIALGYGWHVWHKGQECYDRIRVGMSRSETDSITEGYGYNLTEANGNVRGSVWVFERHKTEPRLVLVFGPDCHLKAKEQDSTVKFILHSIRDAFH
jgi:hypothetical protein